MNKRLVFTVISALLILGGTVVAIRYAKGYRPTRSGISSTGLLNANSFPNGASVYVNGELKTATDTTINLEPGEYEIEIKKEGYFPWKKKLKLEKELVTQTNALLLPQAPGLSPLTYSGASLLNPSPDGQKLLFTTTSASNAKNNGIYVYELTDNPLALQKGPRQISRSTSAYDFSKALFYWSPDSDQILVIFGDDAFVLDSGKFTEIASAKNIKSTLATQVAEWEETSNKRISTQLQRFPVEVVRIASESAANVYISPDQEKLLYTATKLDHLGDNLISSVPASSTQTQSREIKPGNTYVYDRKEDRNFLVRENQSPTPTPTPKITKTAKKIATPAVNSPTITDRLVALRNTFSGLYTDSAQWLPDSKHVLYLQNSIITIREYDGTNTVEAYAGPFAEHFVYPWPNGSKLVILTNLNQNDSVPQNLYAINLR